MRQSLLDILLPPGDPATAHLEALNGERGDQAARPETDHAELTRTAAELQAKLNHASERLVSLRRQVDERERELARVERVAQEQSQRSHPAVTEPN